MARPRRAPRTGDPAGAAATSDVRPALRSGPGRLLVAVYAVFALSASARALVQIATDFSAAPLAYLLSALAAAVSPDGLGAFFWWVREIR